MLDRLDKAACKLLQDIRSDNIFQASRITNLQKLETEAIEEMNYAMVRIRLLYGTELLNRFIKEVDKPLKSFMRQAIDAKRSGGKALKDFNIKRQEEVLRLGNSVDRWEHEFVVSKFMGET